LTSAPPDSTISGPETVTPERLAELITAQAVASGGLVLCTDFDGSIAPLRSRPEDVRALPGAERALAWLSRRGAAVGDGARCPTRIAVISARDSDDVAGRVVLGPEAVVVGNYGLEHTREGEVRVIPEARRWLPALEAAAVEVAALLREGRCPGTRLERKRGGVVLHTRGVEREGIRECALALAHEVAERWELAVVPGKWVAEIHLPVRRSKADAVLALHRGRWSGAALCIAGDDLGDVPMLQLARQAPGALAVGVGDEDMPQGVVEATRWRLPSPDAWADALTGLVELLRLDES
jgi:trehalose-phosphatase